MTSRRRKAFITTMVGAVIFVASVTTFVVYLSSSSSPANGLWCCYKSPITLSSATLYPGTTAFSSKEATSNLTFSLNNSGSATSISAIFLSGGGLDSPINMWSTTNQTSNLVNFTQYSSSGSNVITGGKITALTYYPVTNSSEVIVAQNSSYNYVIYFVNGQSLSGSIVAQ